jgi:hypothetical protein
VPVLWAYALRRAESKSLTGALVAGARARRMAPGSWHRRTSGGAVLPAAGRTLALHGAAAEGFGGSGQAQVGSPPDDRAWPISVALGERRADVSERNSTAAAETSCIEGPGTL